METENYGVIIGTEKYTLIEVLEYNLKEKHGIYEKIINAIVEINFDRLAIGKNLTFNIIQSKILEDCKFTWFASRLVGVEFAGGLLYLITEHSIYTLKKVEEND
jgi:hypothetical protein